MLNDGGNLFGAWIKTKYAIIGNLNDVSEAARARLLGAPFWDTSTLLGHGVAKGQ